MKIKLLKPIYYEGQVVLAGHTIEAAEQHGRELVKKGYAEKAPEPKASGKKKSD